MATFPLPRHPCPACGYPVECATNLRRPVPPHPGDFTICIGCQAVLRFTAARQLRAMTAADWQEVEAIPGQAEAIQQAQALVREGRWRRG